MKKLRGANKDATREILQYSLRKKNFVGDKTYSRVLSALLIPVSLPLALELIPGEKKHCIKLFVYNKLSILKL